MNTDAHRFRQNRWRLFVLVCGEFSPPGTAFPEPLSAFRFPLFPLPPFYFARELPFFYFFRCNLLQLTAIRCKRPPLSRRSRAKADWPSAICSLPWSYCHGKSRRRARRADLSADSSRRSWAKAETLSDGESLPLGHLQSAICHPRRAVPRAECRRPRPQQRTKCDGPWKTRTRHAFLARRAKARSATVGCSARLLRYFSLINHQLYASTRLCQYDNAFLCSPWTPARWNRPWRRLGLSRQSVREGGCREIPTPWDSVLSANLPAPLPRNPDNLSRDSS
jgi:hypothetical protein